MAVMVTDNMKSLKAAGLQVFVKRFARYFGLKFARNVHVQKLARMILGSGAAGAIPAEIMKDGILVLAALIKAPPLFINASTALISGLTPELANDFWVDAIYELFQEFADAVVRDQKTKGADLTEQEYEKLADETLEKAKDKSSSIKLKEGLAKARFILDGAVPHKLTCGTVLLKVTTVQEYPKKPNDKGKLVEDRSAKPTTKKVYPAGMREVSLLEALEEGVDLDYRPECCGGVKHLADNAKAPVVTTASAGELSLQGCLVEIREGMSTAEGRGSITGLLEKSFSVPEVNAVFARVNTVIDWRPKLAGVRQYLLVSTSNNVVDADMFIKLVERGVPPFKASWIVQAGKTAAQFVSDLLLDQGVAQQFGNHLHATSTKVAADLHASNAPTKVRVATRNRRLNRR